MPDFRQVTDQFSTSPQVTLADIALAAKSGFRVIVNNRPDGESADQPRSADVDRAASAVGLTYHHLPFVGRPTQAQIDALREILASAPGPVLGFCRSGTRSIHLWAMAVAQTLPPAVILSAGAAAGYDLTPALVG